MDDITVPNDEERAKLIASLKQAEDEIKEGKGIEYVPEEFRRWLVMIYRGSKPS
jgi:hypothetical protein